jgi:hypothetical protein
MREKFAVPTSYFLKNLSTRGWISSLLSFSKCKEMPKYLIGKEHIGQQNRWEII